MSDTVYGIDLGTTYSAIARVNEFGQPEIIKSFDGGLTTPSVVLFEGESDIVVGEHAKRGLITDPENGASLIKRHMGTDHPQEFGGKVFTPESISALILAELVKTANDELNEDSKRVVITVPAYFGVKEKEATKQAGIIAGLEVLTIITEPVAAALFAGIRDGDAETLLVYDLGGGTFDTTIMRSEAGMIDVVAIDGNKTLGGADWDESLAQLVCDKFIAQAGLGDDYPRLDAEFEAELLGQTEEAKKSLTKRESATVRCRYEDKDEQITITRLEFEVATKGLLDQTLDIAERAVATAKVKIPDLTIDKVVLVGGSSKMPMVDAALRDRLGWNPLNSDFDLGVAKGAAIVAKAIADGTWVDPGSAPEAGQGATEAKAYLGGSATLSVSNVLSRGVGVLALNAEDGEHVDFLEHANDSIPTPGKTKRYYTSVDGQTAANIKLYEQVGEIESKEPADNRLLQEKLLPLPALPEGSPIDVTIHITAEGLARVTAFDPNSGQSIEVEANISVLSEADVAKASAEHETFNIRS